MTKVNMSGWSQEQMANWQDPMLPTGFNKPGINQRPEAQVSIQQGGPQQTAQILTQPNWQNPQQTGLGGLAGNSNLGMWRDQLFGQGGPLGGGPRQYPFTQGPPRGRP